VLKKKEKRMMPLWVGILCVLLAVTSLSFTLLTWAQNNQVVLPFIEEMLFVQPNLHVQSFELSYNLVTRRYDHINVTVKNFDSAPHSGTIYVKFFTNGDVQIAYSDATSTGTIDGGYSVEVPFISLNWLDNYTVSDVVKAFIQIQE